MSLFIEKETDTDFSFDEEALAKEVTDYAIEHEGFPFEAGNAEKAMDKLKEENKELQMKIVQLETEIKNNK